jgi:hypothetical protein
MLFIIILQVVNIALTATAIFLIRRKVVTKISLNKTEPGVYLMDARHERAIQDRMEVEE